MSYEYQLREDKWDFWMWVAFSAYVLNSVGWAVFLIWNYIILGKPL